MQNPPNFIQIKEEKKEFSHSDVNPQKTISFTTSLIYLIIKLTSPPKQYKLI